jgi:DHA1 family bicyclomycin/chloramphenicol resistance-like MFS transporter
MTSTTTGADRANPMWLGSTHLRPPVTVLVAVPESLPSQATREGLRSFALAGRQVLGQRRYLGYLLASGSAMGAVFACVATSAFMR